MPLDLNVIAGTILGGLISGVIGILLEHIRVKNEARMKHFRDLKESCINPLKGELTFIFSKFKRFDEDVVTSVTYEEMLKREIRWWENYSIKGRIGNPVLFDDLGRHFKGLPEKLREIETFLKEKYPEFLENLVELLKTVEHDERLIELSGAETAAVTSQVSEYPFRAVFFLAIEYDKLSWPNVYGWLVRSENKSLIYKIGEEYRNSKPAIEIRDIMREAEHLIRPCIERLDRILHKTKLEGSCEYVSGLLPWP